MKSLTPLVCLLFAVVSSCSSSRNNAAERSSVAKEHNKEPVASQVDVKSETEPQAIPAIVSALVCVYCTGPLAVDDEGHAIVTLYLTVDPSASITGLRLAGLELTDLDGVPITRGTPREHVGIVGDSPRRDLGKFNGSLATGVRVVLWTTATLDMLDNALRTTRPTHYGLRLVADDGLSLDIRGAMEQPGSTAGL